MSRGAEGRTGHCVPLASSLTYRTAAPRLFAHGISMLRCLLTHCIPCPLPEVLLDSCSRAGAGQSEFGVFGRAEETRCGATKQLHRAWCSADRDGWALARLWTQEETEVPSLAGSGNPSRRVQHPLITPTPCCRALASSFCLCSRYKASDASEHALHSQRRPEQAVRPLPRPPYVPSRRCTASRDSSACALTSRALLGRSFGSWTCQQGIGATSTSP